MSTRFGTKAWSVLVPEGWSARHDQECATLVANPEVGALQISSLFKDSAVDEADLRDFAADHLNSGATARPAAAGDFVGFEIAFETTFEGEVFYCRHWFLSQDCQAVFVTYTCPVEVCEAEIEEVEGIVQSLAAPAPKGQKSRLWKWRA
jgi:hypothetical protein